jgi:microcystin-dependent protein
MADSTSTTLQLLLMGDGLHGSDWGAQNNANLVKIENAIIGQTVLTATGGSITLTDDQARSAILYVSGTPSSDQTIIVPGRTRGWTVINATSGTFNTIIKTASAGAVATLRPGKRRQIFCDATDVYTVDDQASETGFIKMFAGPNSSLPLDYLLCDGRAVSRATYVDLWQTIGGFYGTGDGTTTFNLPDFRGRVPAGPDNMGSGAAGRLTSIGALVGQAGGEETHTLSTGEIPNHNHTLHETAHNHTVTVGDPGHTHHVGDSLAAGAGGASPNPANYGSSTGSGCTTTSPDLDRHHRVARGGDDWNHHRRGRRRRLA